MCIGFRKYRRPAVTPAKWRLQNRLWIHLRLNRNQWPWKCSISLLSIVSYNMMHCAFLQDNFPKAIPHPIRSFCNYFGVDFLSSQFLCKKIARQRKLLQSNLFWWPPLKKTVYKDLLLLLQYSLSTRSCFGRHDTCLLYIGSCSREVK